MTAYTLAVTTIGTSDDKMELATAVAADATKAGGNALIWGSADEFKKFTEASGSDETEVTTLTGYSDGYAFGFTWDLGTDKIGRDAVDDASGFPTTPAATTEDGSMMFGICITGSEGTGDAEIAGTSCAGWNYTYDQCAKVDKSTGNNLTCTITGAAVQFYSDAVSTATTEMKLTTEDLTAVGATGKGTFTAVAAQAPTTVKKGYECTSSGALPTAGADADLVSTTITCARLLPLEKDTAKTDIRFDGGADSGFSGSIFSFAGKGALTATLATSLKGAFQAATVAGAVVVAALTF